MNYRPNPLLYSANEDFLSSFTIALTMSEEVRHEVLSRAVAKAMKRYPYFSVRAVKRGNSIILEHNPLPIPVFADGRSATLGSEECNGHLLTFGCDGRRILINCSHFLSDGMGSDPLMKTVLYLYVSELYGTEGLNLQKITMPDSPVPEEEYEYPFFEEPREIKKGRFPKKPPEEVYSLDPEAFDGEGLYAYHLHISQKAMMAKANPSDGSPSSFLSVMLYRALCTLDEKLDLPMTVHIQHQYRAALKKFPNKHSLVCYLPVTLPPIAKTCNVEYQNTLLRGQIILGCLETADIKAVNRLISVIPSEEMPYEEKKQAMRRFVEDSIKGKTCQISYVGKTDWCGLDRYVKDVHAYIGEKNTKSMLIMEVMTVGEDFSVNFMQSGKGRRYVDAFMNEIENFGIPVDLVNEMRYELCDTVIPD